MTSGEARGGPEATTAGETDRTIADGTGDASAGGTDQANATRPGRTSGTSHASANTADRGSAAARLADGLLRLAVRHWPAELREPLTREWRAELAAAEGRPLTRAVRRLRFALSLAVSPPSRQDVLFGAGRALQPVLLLLAVPLLCYGCALGLPDLGAMLLERRESPSWAHAIMSVAGQVVSVVLLGLIGGWLGRRLPVRGAAVVAPLVMAAGFAAIGWAQWARLPDDPGDGTVVTVAPAPVAASLWWGVGMAALATAMPRLRRNRPSQSRPSQSPPSQSPPSQSQNRASQHQNQPSQSRWRWLAAGIGVLLVFEIAGALAGWQMAPVIGIPRTEAPWWFLESFAYHAPRADDMPLVVAQTLWPLVAGTAFVTGYAARARHAPRPVPEPVADLPRHQRLGLGVTTAGLALWVYASLVLPGRVDAVAAVDEVLSWELRLWSHELRQAAIVIAVLGLVVAHAGRAAVWPVALLAGAALLVADAAIDRADATGPIVPAAGAAIIAAAWWLGAASPARARGRRHLAGVAVAAAFCAPGPFFQVGWHGTVPAAFPVLTGVVVATALTVAGLAALAARPRPVRHVARVAVVAAPAVLAVVLVAVGFGYALTLGLPFVAYYLAVLAPDRSRFARVATAVGAVVLAVPVAYLQLLPAQLVGDLLMDAAGYGRPVDGLPFFPGVLVAAIPLAALLARPAPLPHDQGVLQVVMTT